jgi:hypothetical protein
MNHTSLTFILVRNRRITFLSLSLPISFLIYLVYSQAHVQHPSRCVVLGLVHTQQLAPR